MSFKVGDRVKVIAATDPHMIANRDFNSTFTNTSYFDAVGNTFEIVEVDGDNYQLSNGWYYIEDELDDGGLSTAIEFGKDMCDWLRTKFKLETSEDLRGIIIECVTTYMEM